MATPSLREFYGAGRLTQMKYFFPCKNTNPSEMKEISPSETEEGFTRQAGQACQHKRISYAKGEVSSVGSPIGGGLIRTLKQALR
jgi:hypothetical protein